MQVYLMTFTLRASWVRSLKEKRSIVKSLIAKLQNRFHVSVAEIACQDAHQLIGIGAVMIVSDQAPAERIMEEISRFVEENCEAELIDEKRELR